jgi:hypothetical protein
MGRFVFAATAALCVSCSSGAQPICAPCPWGQNIAVTGPLNGDGLRVCVGDRPCVAVPIAGRTCGQVACDFSSGALRLTMNFGAPRPLAGLPVKVTVTRHGRATPLRGSGVMRFVNQTGPCPCSYAYASVTVR